MKRILSASPLTALASNLLLIFALYTLTRILFIVCNTPLYADHLTFGYTLSLLAAGLRFDLTAILYLNCWMIVGFLLPLHFKERSKRYYTVQRWIFTIINFIGLAANLCDCAYFPFTGRRTTWNVLVEFGNEGNFMTIILHECLPYWYLIIVAIAIPWMLYKCYRQPATDDSSTPRHLLRYYITMTLALAISAGLTVAGMRGGFTTAVRPITMSNANQYVIQAIDAGIVLNTPFSIIRTLNKKPFKECNYMSQAEAERLYSPVHNPDGAQAADALADKNITISASDTTAGTPAVGTPAGFKDYNVVVLILESFGKQAMARGYMPFVESLSHKGLSFEYSYACGRKSIDGMPSVLSSIPSFVEPFFLTPASLNNLSGIAGELSRHKGYTSAFFHGAQNGSMGFQAFANSTGFQKYYGRTEYNQDPRYHGDDDFDGTWAIWDEEFLQFYCDKMTEMKQPFVTSVFTATSHSPYAKPARYAKQFPDTNPKVFSCTAYSDNAVRLFFEKAAKQPWYNNTIFVITADHTSPDAIDPEFTSDLGRFKVPIIIYAPSMPQLSGVNSDIIVSQADIMPTILGLMGYDRPYIAFGQDALHTPQKDKFAVNYVPGNGYYQFLQGDWMLQFDGNSIIHAYRFKEDKLQKHDLKGQHPKEYEMRLKSIIQQYMYRMNHNMLVAR